MKITYLGTTVLLFDDGKDQLLFDAYISRPGGLLQAGTAKLKTDKKLAETLIHRFRINRLRGIFISHSHFDHVLDAPYFSQRCHAHIYGSPSALNVARGGDIQEENLHSYEDTMEYSIGDFHIQVIPSIHSKAHWYNDDLGQTIDEPLRQPAGKNAYKEGGSFDFLITHKKKNYLIRPSFNYQKGQLDDIRADVLFLGIGGLAKADKKTRNMFFKETIEKVKPELVIPVHWDNFFSKLKRQKYFMPTAFEKANKSLYLLADYCGRQGIDCVVQLPLSSFRI